jgi:hypothetical protein
MFYPICSEAVTAWRHLKLPRLTPPPTQLRSLFPSNPDPIKPLLVLVLHRPKVVFAADSSDYFKYAVPSF